VIFSDTSNDRLYHLPASSCYARSSFATGSMKFNRRFRHLHSPVLAISSCKPIFICRISTKVTSYFSYGCPDGIVAASPYSLVYQINVWHIPSEPQPDSRRYYHMHSPVILSVQCAADGTDACKISCSTSDNKEQRAHFPISQTVRAQHILTQTSILG
jgi:hypothetical protein